MRKESIILILLLILLGGFLFAANKVTIRPMITNQVVTSNEVIETIEYRNHTYIKFRDKASRSIAIEHDPDCQCMIDYE